MHANHSRFALTSLDQQSTRALIVTLFCVCLGMPLRHELRVPGLGDAEAIRQAPREREGIGR